MLKPKPKHVKIPTIMFILRIEKTKRFSSFFKRFIRDPLLIVQILIFLFLILSIAGIYLLLPVEVNPKSDIVFIMDGSASMQSTDILPSRFQKSKEVAINFLDSLNPESKISIIFAENIPILLLRNSDKETARKILEKLNPSDVESNLQDAIIFTTDLLSDSKFSEKKIFVFSDFSNVGDVKLAKGISLSKGIDVKFVKIFKDDDGKNFGITSINAKRFLAEKEKFYLTFNVKNFNSENENVKAEIFLDNNLLSTIIKEISPEGEELFHFNGKISPNEHELIIKISTQTEDNLNLDNNAYFILPEVKQYKILLITNGDSYLRYALESNPDFSLTVANPPVIPKLDEFDTIILGEFDNELILPGTFKEILDYVKNSKGNLIILASDSLGKIENENLNELLPLKIEDLVTALSKVKVERQSEILKDVILENLVLKKYLKAIEKNGTIVIATSKASPLLAVTNFGGEWEKKVSFIGINPNPEWSNFYLSSSFPIFFSNLIKWINKEEGLESKNLKSGEYVLIRKDINITTPSKRKFLAKELIFDEVGIYNVALGKDKEEKISVNLENEKESNIKNSLSLETINDPENFNIKKEFGLEENFLWKYLLFIAIIFLFIETILYKRRGLI